MNRIKSIAKRYSRELSIFAALLLIIAVFSILKPRYIQIDNLLDILEQATINGFLAIGVTFAIITGGIDLSVGSVMAVSIVCCGQLAVRGLPPIVVMVLGIILGIALGCFNGLLVTKMKLQPFIATLGTNSVLRGLAYLVTGGWPVLNIPRNFRILFQIQFLPNIRLYMIYFVAVAIVFSFILKKTSLGTYVYAVGSNEEATRLSGINVNKYKMYAYAFCGVMAAAAGMITLAKLGTGEPTAGQGYELNAIAAAAIGGASLAGGKGSILGTVIGALTLSALKVGLVVVGMDTFFQYIATGLIIVIAAYFEIIQGTISDFLFRR
jgi:ribose transport system permease protein